MVGRAVVPYQARPVYGQHHMQVHQADILHDLVVGPLQEGGINGRNRDHALLGKAACHGNGVLLRNANVEGPLREPVGKGRQARTGGRAQPRLSWAARSTMVWPKESEKLAVFSPRLLPVAGSNFPMPWNLVGSSWAGG